MRNMFSGCTGLTELDLSNFDTSNVTGQGMQQMFNMCNKLVNLNVSSFNTSKLTDIQSMFSSCGVESLDISNFDLSKVSAVSSGTFSCSKLVNLRFGTNLGKAYTRQSANYSTYTLTLSNCKLLTHDSLMDVINKLYDLNLSYKVAEGGTLYTQKLVLGADNLAKLTEEEIAIATNKGWTVS